MKNRVRVCVFFISLGQVRIVAEDAIRRMPKEKQWPVWAELLVTRIQLDMSNSKDKTRQVEISRKVRARARRGYVQGEFRKRAQKHFPWGTPAGIG